MKNSKEPYSLSSCVIGTKEQLYSVFLVSLFSTSVFCADLPDWDKWRGPNGNSIIYEKDWDPGTLGPQPKYAWRATVGFGYSSLCIKGDYLYTMGNNE